MHWDRNGPRKLFPGLESGIDHRSSPPGSGLWATHFTYVTTTWVMSPAAVGHESSGLPTRTCQGENPGPGKRPSGHLLFLLAHIPFPFFCHRILTSPGGHASPYFQPCGSVGLHPLCNSQTVVFYWLLWLVHEWVGDPRQANETHVQDCSWTYWKRRVPHL